MESLHKGHFKLIFSVISSQVFHFLISSPYFFFSAFLSICVFIYSYQGLALGITKLTSWLISVATKGGLTSVTGRCGIPGDWPLQLLSNNPGRGFAFSKDGFSVPMRNPTFLRCWLYHFCQQTEESEGRHADKSYKTEKDRLDI